MVLFKKFLSIILIPIFLRFSIPKNSKNEILGNERQIEKISSSNRAFFSGYYEIVEEELFSYQTNTPRKYKDQNQDLGKRIPKKKNSLKKDSSLKEFQKLAQELEKDIFKNKKNKNNNKETRNGEKQVIEVIEDIVKSFSPLLVSLFFLRLFKK